MVAKRVVACLDVDDRGVVKGRKFDDLQRQGDPERLALRYEGEGADELVVLRVDAWNGGALTPSFVRGLARQLSIPLTVGGGIGTTATAESLLSAGADRVSVNSLALERPGAIRELADRFGRQAVVVSLDVRGASNGDYRVYARGGTRATPWSAAEWARCAVAHGAGEILATSIDRDGSRSGFDLALLRHLRDCVTTPLTASGGAGSPNSFLEAFAEGADAALAAGIFHDRTTSIADVKRFLSARGVEVR